MDIGLIAGILTGIEIPVLVRWLTLALTRQHPGEAVAVLFGGILFEEIVRFRLITNKFPAGPQLLTLIQGVAIETLAWILPITFGFSPVLTLATLFVGLAFEHAVMASAISGKFDLSKVLDFSAVEAFGGAYWLVAPNTETLIVFIIASLLEHIQGVRQGLGKR
jgi:hypothetical protein